MCRVKGEQFYVVLVGMGKLARGREKKERNISVSRVSSRLKEQIEV